MAYIVSGFFTILYFGGCTQSVCLVKSKCLTEVDRVTTAACNELACVLIFRGVKMGQRWPAMLLQYATTFWRVINVSNNAIWRHSVFRGKLR